MAGEYIMKTILLNQTYIKSYSSVGGKMEADGPVGYLLDKTYKDHYINEKSYEKAEIAMLSDAMEIALKKGNITVDDIDVSIGGDLLNQLLSSHYFARKLKHSFMGVYAACATSALTMQTGALLLEKGMNHVACFVSSHNATAERQFRYPNEYGIQKKDSVTFTVTGAGCVILSKEKQPVKISAMTIGEIVDWDYKDANDMGCAMAPAAYKTITDHLKNRNQTLNDYDLVITGDLSRLGSRMLRKLFEEDGIDNPPLSDCGNIIFDQEEQEVFSGGSGAACSMVILNSYILPKLKEKIFRHVLFVPTGALLSTTALYQKSSIPCIAHALEIEVSN